MIKAVIFDMDGLLANTEPLWSIAESLVFQKNGIPVQIEMTRQTTGLRLDEVIDYWSKKIQLQNISKPALILQILETLKALIHQKACKMEGVDEIIRFFADKKLPMAVASSSPMEIITTVLDKLDIIKHFPIIQSAENEKFGKPHPAVYLKTIQQLNLPSVNILAFEDSVNGVKAAKAAQLNVIAVPAAIDFNNPKFQEADLKLPSLLNFESKHFELFHS